ncbi:MAG: PTS sugar transporter subunit IIA [Pirellulaceae bacterium]|nr:PTS sugar transporter subunit IIA [Pirellulaceae bacterium]
MAENDFDIESLARFLHISPQQVDRLVTRGRVPGRKVAGRWRFSSAEIHHWMEERMGLLEDGELVQVEGALARADNIATSEVLLREMLSVDTIAVPLKAKTKGSVISEMANLAAQSGMLWDPDKMEEAVRTREQLQTTAMESGIALLHPRRPLSNILSEPVLAIGVSHQGIPFGGSRRLTDLFFLICSTDDRGHLRTLARLSRLIANEDLVTNLRNAVDQTEIHERISQGEADLNN